MKKLTILVITILITCQLVAINVASEELNQDKRVFAFSNLKILENDEYIDLEINGANSKLLNNNHYIVPERLVTFIYDIGTEIIDVKCIPKNIQSQSLDKELRITPEPVLSSSQTILNSNNIKLENPVTINTWYEYNIGCGLIGQQRNIILKVNIYPVQYYPSENLIEWAENIEIVIEYNEPERTSTQSNGEYDFIVLTPTEYSDELSSLISHKNNRGVSTKLVTLTDIYNGNFFPIDGRDNPEKIKYFIKNSVENWDTRYVLLVGGADDFPTRETHVYVDYGSGDGELFASDLYYADIYTESLEFSSWDTNENDVFGEFDWGNEHLTDDVDLHPDVYLGRLACVSSNEVITCVNKIINYESNEAYTTDWFNDIVVIGGDTAPHDDEDILEGEYVNQNVIDIMDGFIPTKCWASEGTLGTRTPINNAINKGAGFVCFAGHGNVKGWSTHPYNQEDVWIPVSGFENSHVSNLKNNEELPIVITGACSVAKFIHRDDSFTWSFVSNPNGGGVASVGPSSLSWGYDTSYVIQDLGGRMHIELIKAYKQDGAFTFGEMWGRAISNYIHPGLDGGDHKTIEQWQPFGDPTLAIADESLPPNTPDPPEGPASGSEGKSYTYSASTTDPDGDKISYLFEWGEGTFSGWTNFKNSGDTSTASHTWTTSGTYQIRAKAKDDHGVQSDWSEPIEVSMPRIKIYNNDFISQILVKISQLFKFIQNIKT